MYTDTPPSGVHSRTRLGVVVDSSSSRTSTTAPFNVQPVMERPCSQQRSTERGQKRKYLEAKECPYLRGHKTKGKYITKTHISSSLRLLVSSNQHSKQRGISNALRQAQHKYCWMQSGLPNIGSIYTCRPSRPAWSNSSHDSVEALRINSNISKASVHLNIWIMSKGIFTLFQLLLIYMRFAGSTATESNAGECVCHVHAWYVLM